MFVNMNGAGLAPVCGGVVPRPQVRFCRVFESLDEIAAGRTCDLSGQPGNSRIEGGQAQICSPNLRWIVLSGRAQFFRGRRRNVRFRLGDLPRLLRTVVLEIKPEWKGVGPSFESLPTSPTR